MRVRAGGALLGAVLFFAAVARAGEGVIEINEAAVLAGSITPGDAPGYPVEIFTPGSYRLTSNLVVPGGSPAGIFIYAEGTQLDLGGFSITSVTQCTGTPVVCTPTGTGVGIDATGASDVVLRNGRVAGFGVWGVGLFEGSRVEKLDVSSNGTAGIMGDRNCVVSGSVVRRNGGPGIQVGIGSHLSENVISMNKGFGADVGSASLLEQNVFDANGGGSIRGGRATSGNVCDDGGCSARGTRRFYLSRGGVAGSAARSSCVVGFHMAAFWELEDLSVLEYAGTIGVSGFDTGTGPPNNPGWVRTGTASSAANAISCNLWTTTSGSGMWAALVEPSSAGSASNISPWVKGTDLCTTSLPVWCIED
jgi:hypothetical protein